MADRSYLRDNHGPRVVDAGSGRDKGQSSSRRQRDGTEKSHHRAKRDSAQRSPKKESSHRQKRSNSQNNDQLAERQSFELHVIGQPKRDIVLGAPVETSVMVSLRMPTPNMATNAGNIDTSKLFAVTSLVTDGRSGDRMALEAGLLTGQKMFDSVHPMPVECAERLASREPCRLVLGYSTFPGLVIRQPGNYRIRTTLIKMNCTGGMGTSIVAIDSDPIKVERPRVGATPRKQQRVYS
ncbi:hypothetical protein M433DRAFT_400618 [Acidomyces richmondensis BFW]|nr:MAG: hypothetical protein FE78DRAFT_30261 [Acidomyces sp. 'richmondensis']KYG42598.1 hypothetical protein M433DRAFT_400618 [Acidomyces richmondensis BFW]